METLFFFASYGYIVLGCILAILTYLLFGKEHFGVKPALKEMLVVTPRKPKPFYVFMAFSLALVILGLIAVYERRVNINAVELPSYPEGHPGKVIIPAANAIWQAEHYRQNKKWYFSFSDIVPGECGRRRVKLRLASEFELFNSSSKPWSYDFFANILVSKDFKEPIDGMNVELTVKSMQGSSMGPTEAHQFVPFVRKNNQLFNKPLQIPIQPGEHKWFRWETVKEIEYDLPFHDFLVNYIPTDTMEFHVRAGNTKIKTDIQPLRNIGYQEEKTTESGDFDLRAPGAFLINQGAEINFTVPESSTPPGSTSQPPPTQNSSHH